MIVRWHNRRAGGESDDVEMTRSRLAPRSFAILALIGVLEVFPERA